MSALRRLVLLLLSRYFRIARVPPSIATIVHNPQSFTIITPGSSLVLQAMLDSFARRSGLDGIIAKADQESSGAATNSEAHRFLYWLSIEDEDGLAKVVASGAAQNFSTLNIFRGRGPVKSHPRYRMSILQQAALLFGCRFLVIIFGRPIAIDQGGDVHKKLLVRRLKLDFYRNLKLVRGTPFQSIEAQANVILSGAEFEREIRIIAARLGKSESSVKSMARNAFFKMAANPIAPMYWCAAPLARLFTARLFSEVSARGLEQLSQAIRENTVVLVPMHRSHLDYVLLGFMLYEANLNPPVVAAGVNLSFWPFGFLIRSLGGYFVKREARHDRIHAMLIKRYVTYLIKRGHLQEFFIEGGRSRSGKMSQPKLGLLSTMVNAFVKGVRRDILFVPVSFTYENLMEDEVFGDENTGRSKTKENLFSLLAARDLFRRKYGEVILKFGQAISLGEFVAELERRDLSKRVDTRTIVATLATKISQNIRDQSDISLTSLAYSALMSSPGYGLLAAELSEQIKNMARLAKLVSETFQFEAQFTNSLDSFLAGKETILSDLARGRVVNSTRFLDSEAYTIPGGKRFTADFYKNSSIHLFFLPALMSLLEMLEGQINLKDALRFHEILAYEFQLPEKDEFSRQFSQLCTKFKGSGILLEKDGRLVFSERSQGIFIPGLLAANLQGLLWVYLHLEKCLEQPEETIEPGANQALGSIPYSRLTARLLAEFKTAAYLGYINRTEAASQSAISGALDSLRARQIVDFDESRTAEKRVILLKQDLDVIELLRRANAALQAWQKDWQTQRNKSAAELSGADLSETAKRIA